jgi:hypothetical protein
VVRNAGGAFGSQLAAAIIVACATPRKSPR